MKLTLRCKSSTLAWDSCHSKDACLLPFSPRPLGDTHSGPFSVSGTCTGDSAPAPVNPCYDGSHTCDTTARCRPGTGVDYTCECTPGFQGDGRSCVGKRRVVCFCHAPLVPASLSPASQSGGHVRVVFAVITIRQ